MRAARAGAAWASMSTSRVWISAMRRGSLASSASRQQGGALDVGVEHELDQRLRAAGRLLLDAADAGLLGDRDRAAFPADFAADQAEQRRLARAVAPDQADVRAGRQRRRRLVDQQAFAEAISKIVDMQHAALLPRRAAQGKGRRRPRLRYAGEGVGRGRAGPGPSGDRPRPGPAACALHAALLSRRRPLYMPRL